MTVSTSTIVGSVAGLDGSRNAYGRRRLSGARALFEQLQADGVRAVFGNPGTTEQAFMDLLADYPSITYYLALHESVAVGMADAYGRATGRPALVELHIAAGLGNAMGMLYNAWAGQSSLVVYVGQAPREGLLQEPFLSADLATVARPFSKWAAQIDHVSDVPRALRRAFKVAEQPPRGPVVLAIPSDVMDAEGDVLIEPTTYVSWRSAPDPSAVSRAADLLLEARAPIVAVGDEMGLSEDGSAAVALAELLGAPLVPTGTGVVVPLNHPLCQPRRGAPYRSRDMRAYLGSYDVLLAAGTNQLAAIFPDAVGSLPDDLALIQVAHSSWELGKSHAGAVLVAADPAVSLIAIAAEVRRRATPAQREQWEQRQRQVEETTRTRREEREARFRILKPWDGVPISPHRLMAEVARALPREAVVFDESLTSGHALETFFRPSEPWRWFRTRGGGIGGGLPGALGVQAAYPDRLVVGLVSEGASMFTNTALWTAAHHRLPVKFVVCNNSSYRVLKQNLLAERSDETRGRQLPHMDLDDPPIRFDRLAEAMGVPAFRVDHPDQLGDALRQTLRTDGPVLLDVVVDGAL